jgi:predicted dehydrogenase
MPTIAFAGCAHIHTPGFQNMLRGRPSFQVKRVWDHHAARGQQRARELNAQFVDELKSLAADPDIQGVVVCCETDRHQAVVETLAAHGKHLFVEKPLGLKAADAYESAQAIEQAGVKFQTGYFMRGMPSIRTLKKLVDEGFFGHISRVRASNCHSGALGGWFDARPNDPAGDWRWMADPKQSGVGGFGDLGTHVLDLLLWMFGPVKTATATLDPGTKRYEGCDETGEGMMVFESGVIGTFAAGWVDVANPVSFQISGTKACASIIDNKLHLTHVDTKLDAVLSDPMPGLPHAFELWLDAMEGKNVPLVSAREAAYRNAVMEAMYLGAATHTWVTPKKG